jgi:hypothetical protein
MTADALVSIGLSARKASHAGPKTSVSALSSLIAWCRAGGRERARVHALAASPGGERPSICATRSLVGPARSVRGIIKPMGRAHR